MPGSFFNANARVGALHNSEFGWMVSDTSRDYWGLQYIFQIRVGMDSSYSVAWKKFLADAATGEILVTTGADEGGGSSFPDAYTLGENYPNPFNPSTMITFSVPTQSRVTIEVINVLGQKVATLVNDIRSPGTHQVVWQARVPSGLYLYRMEASANDAPAKQFSQVRKMMLIR